MEFKYYGDEWLKLRDLFNTMSINEVIGYQIVSGITLLPQNELPYLTGEKEFFKRQLGFFIGITRVLNNDTTGRYKKMLEERNVLHFNLTDDKKNPLKDYAHFG